LRAALLPKSLKSEAFGERLYIPILTPGDVRTPKLTL
jgi:hypothetical protein